MMVTASKFGMDKEKETTVETYSFYNEFTSEVYPVILIDQEVNPWGALFYPSRLFILPLGFPKEFDLFNTAKILEDNIGWKVTSSQKINLASCKKEITKVKDLAIEDGCINIPSVISTTTDYSVGYIDKLKGNEHVSKLFNKEGELYNWTIVDEIARLELIHESITLNTQCDVNGVKLFHSNCPMKMDRLEYIKRLERLGGESTSIVYVKYDAGIVQIHNFYRYVDIWSGDENGK